MPWIMIFLATYLAGPQQNQGSPVEAGLDGREVLSRANEAIKGVKVVQYSAHFEVQGPGRDQSPQIKASAVVMGWKNNAFEKYRFEGTIQQPGSSSPEKYTLGTDGETYYLIDWQKKIVYADIDPAVQGKKWDAFRSIIVSRFVRPEGFAMELAAPTIERKEDARVGDQDCFRVHIHSKGGDQSAWYFGKKDYLLRRMERFIGGGDGQRDVRVLTLESVSVNPSFVQDPFKLIVPEGFARTDEFAP